MASKVEKICISLPSECMSMLDEIKRLRFEGFNMKRSQLITFCIQSLYWNLNSDDDR